MRFKDLSQETTQNLWGKWKNLIRELLEEFNLDVFNGRGVIQENTHKERSYLLLETKRECLYVFPASGNILIFSVYRHKIQKEHLKLNYSTEKLDEENIIGWNRLDTAGIKLRGRIAQQSYVEWTMRRVYRKYLIRSQSQL